MSLRPNERTEARRSRYKVAVDADEGRRRREDNLVEIRKNRREESLLKKRREGFQYPQPDAAGFQVENKLESIPALVALMWSNDPGSQLEATTQFRKFLSKERNAPIEEVIQSGVVPRFVEFLARDDYPQLQFEAAWALTNIASGTSDNTRAVIDHGAVPIFVRLLGSSSDDVREQTVWALGNVAGDSPKCRDLVLNCGALAPLLAQFSEHTKLSMLRNSTWTLSNFCRGKPQPPFDQVKRALPIIAQLVHSDDVEVLTDACWALSYLSDGTNDKIQAVIESGICSRLVELLVHPSPAVLIPALRAVGNIVTGDDGQTQVIIDHLVLPCLLNLLTQNYKKSIKKEACWTLSNITAGTKDQIQAVIASGIFSPLVHLLQDAEFDVKKEAVWTVSNATSGGTHEQIKFLVGEGCIKPLCDILICPDPKIVTVCLEALENILKVGEAEKNMGNTGDMNVYGQMIDDAEGLEKIENLQNHDNNEIYEKAVKILETYWLDDEDELPSADAQQSGFNFGGELPVPSGGFNFNNRSNFGRPKKSSSPSSTKIKTCTYCLTSITPLWRGGPFGPKSLCNACGIKYNKKKRESLFGLDKTKNEKTKFNNKKVLKHKHDVFEGNKSIKKTKRNDIFHKLKMRLMALGTDIREEEQAAILLMAISCGSVYS